MKIRTLIPLTTIAFAALAQAKSSLPFDLETRGSLVCKVGVYYPTPECLPSATSQGGVPEVIDLVPRVRALTQAYPSGQPDETMTIDQAKKYGGALFIAPNDRTKILRYYRELSVRNIALDTEHITRKDGVSFVPFVASVRWKGALYMEGTLQVEGVLRISTETMKARKGETVGQSLDRWFGSTDYNDSSTELRSEPLRVVEKIARFVHFTRLHGLKESLNQDTQALLLNVVGPALIGELVLLPITENLAGFVSTNLTTPAQ